MLLQIVIAMALTEPQAAAADEGWSVGHYKIEIRSEQSGERGYRILKDNQQVFAQTPGQVRIISVFRGREIDSEEPKTTDITGDGIPDMIVEGFPRFQSCCFSYAIFSLGTRFRQIAALTGFRSPLTFQDLNRDSIYEITGEDWTFTSWYASPRIIFAYNGREYRFAPNRMRRLPPTSAALAAKAKTVARAQKVAGLSLPAEAYWFMLDLVYGGNVRSAWKFLDLLWPVRDSAGKADFREGFMMQLRRSPYWPEIRALNAIP
jgi:hypothetical protein